MSVYFTLTLPWDEPPKALLSLTLSSTQVVAQLVGWLSPDSMVSTTERGITSCSNFKWHKPLFFRAWSNYGLIRIKKGWHGSCNLSRNKYCWSEKQNGQWMCEGPAPWQQSSPGSRGPTCCFVFPWLPDQEELWGVLFSRRKTASPATAWPSWNLIQAKATAAFLLITVMEQNWVKVFM